MCNIIRYIILVFSLGIICTACFTPVNMAFETAASLEKKQVEFTGSVSSNYVSTEDRFGTTNLGIRLGYGLNSTIDLKLYYRMLLNDQDNFSSQHLAFYPKISLISHTLAFSPSIGAYIFGSTGGSEVTYVWSPRVLYTMPLSETLDLTLSSKVDFFLDSNSEELWGFNVGLNFDNKKGNINFRPEIGILINPGEQPTLWTIGLAYVRILE